MRERERDRYDNLSEREEKEDPKQREAAKLYSAPLLIVVSSGSVLTASTKDFGKSEANNLPARRAHFVFATNGLLAYE